MRRSCTLLGSVLLAFVLAGDGVADGIVREAPLDFSLPALRSGDAPIRLAEYRNKIVYLDVWASWCAPCLRAMPELEALREKFRGQPFEVVGVSVDHDPAAARAMLERVGVHYPNAFDRDAAQLRALKFANDETSPECRSASCSTVTATPGSRPSAGRPGSPTTSRNT